jgi:hypothetical protein
MTPFEHDAETLLTFIHDLQELICLKGIHEDFGQQVQIVRLLLQDEALEKFNGNYIDPVITAVDATAAENVQENTRQLNQTKWHTAFIQAIEGLLEESLPTMAGKMIKEEIWMIQKPFDMSVEDFVQQMEMINKYIRLWPCPERQYNNTEMRALIEQARLSLWLMDLCKQTTYLTMVLLQVKSYYKLLKSAKNGKWTTVVQGQV